MVATDAISAYLDELATLRRQVEATPELSLREPLLKLTRALAAEAGRKLLVAPEADAEQAGQPDIFIKDGPRLVGFAETKSPGTDLEKWLKTTDQAKRYLASLPNWVLTDYYRFIFIREGEVVPTLELADPNQGGNLSSDDQERVLAAFLAFLSYTPPIVRSPRRLAVELARRARLLRDGIAGVLATENDDGPLRGVFRFYRDTLMSDLDETGFADTFAQTIAYGLFLARLREHGEEFTLDAAVDAVPESIPFLRSALRLLTDKDVLPQAITNLLDDLVALLENTQMDPIRAEIDSGGLERDLVVYFYERFLEQYDAGERKKRGVYYTPPELVDYLVRAAETVLAKEFGLARGLAEPVVTVLDPAVGTGTFLLGAAEHALSTEASKGSASQRKLIREHLLEDFYGFELLPAPYTIAHIKLASFYEGRGHTLRNKERIRVYLTNSMEPHELDATGQLSFLPMVRGIVAEAKDADHVKKHVPVLVIIGNPPYERTSHNSNDHSDGLLEDFYRIDGERIGDRNTGPLRDDYLRFIRWSVWKLLEQPGAPGHGLIGFVTNRAYLERKLHRAVRQYLLRSFDEIHVFDLHGDQREWFADRIDEKVFKEVQAGIALTVFVKRPAAAANSDALATVRYRESFGRRSEKYAACREASIDDGGWQTLTPKAPHWRFVPYEVDPLYETWPSVPDLFPTNVIGFQTHRDQLVVAFSEDELRERLASFGDAEVPDLIWERQGVKSMSDWSLRTAREAVAAEGPRRVMQVTYRGLERRWAAMDERLIDRIRTSVSPHLLSRNDNLALAFATGTLSDGPYAVASRGPVPAAVLSWRTVGAAYFAPLFVHDRFADSWVPNLPANLLRRLAKHGVTTDAEGFFAYVYALLNAKRYRDRYAAALRQDFARIPIAGDSALFDRVRDLGGALVLAHLLEHPNIEHAAPTMDGDDRAVISDPSYDPGGCIVSLAPNLVATDVTPTMWSYQQGAYPVIRGFLEARNGRRLSGGEFDEFRRLVAAVRLTLALLPEVDGLIDDVAATAIPAVDLLDSPA